MRNDIVLDTVTTTVASVLLRSTMTTFGTFLTNKKGDKNQCNITHKDWFNSDCNKTRKNNIGEIIGCFENMAQTL